MERDNEEDASGKAFEFLPVLIFLVGRDMSSSLPLAIMLESSSSSSSTGECRFLGFVVIMKLNWNL